ncbi:hypothetical protein Clacol_001530 [Clathrus columnatus]|uniref:Uncharacterized protein n=1 Tax=Clathrus columnatus TaxID=1419009 RepID=A0AAV5A3K3_9AGAM|nr:hypothetical protein Clacol_001530 [Clathrus columnatus]
MLDQLLETASTDAEFKVADQKSQLNHEEDCLASRCTHQRVESKIQLLKSLYIDHMKNPELELANVIYHFISFQNNYTLLMSKIKSSWLSRHNLNVLHSQRTLLSELGHSKMSILGEPYLLSSYTPPLRSIFKKHAVHEVTCNEYDQKCLATVSVQGDGVHVLEISAMRPIISHTLGPDIRFTCPSILQVHESGKSSIYAITERPDTNSEGSKYDLLKWTDSLSNNSMHLHEQKSSLNVCYITVLTARGTWRIFRLDERGHLMKEASSTLNLNMPRSRGFTLTSITSSFVLIACVEGSSNLHLALWDIRYSVVLATQQFALPSNLITGLKTAPQINLVVATQTEVLVLVSPPTDSEALSSSRSAIFVFPVNIPASSSIALAMGKALDAPVWLLNTKGPPIREEGRRQDLLNRIHDAINNGSPHEADSMFFTWVEEEIERDKAKEKAVADRPNNPAQAAVNKITRRPAIPKLNYRFVAILLDTVLQPSKTSDVPYSSKIPLYLVQRKAVSDNMISSGFISVLRRRDDWKSIHAALQNMGDIPEEQVINLLIEVLENHKRFLRTTNEDMMEVEPKKSTSIPSLASFLPIVLQYQMSSTAACYALKMSLTDADDILLILKELGQILEQSCGQDLIDSTVDSLPSSQTALSFMQLILDAHFLTLLQHPPALSLLRQISDHLQANILGIEDLNRLRGPLNSVLQAQGSASRHFGQKGDKKDRRKNTFNTIVGLYQVEELIL